MVRDTLWYKICIRVRHRIRFSARDSTGGVSKVSVRVGSTFRIKVRVRFVIWVSVNPEVRARVLFKCGLTIGGRTWIWILKLGKSLV